MSFVHSTKCTTESSCIFFDVLLNKLEAMLDQVGNKYLVLLEVCYLTMQPYEINLLVTSLFTQLAAAPYPTFRWLFATGVQDRNVYTILKKVTFNIKYINIHVGTLLVEVVG